MTPDERRAAIVALTIGLSELEARTTIASGLTAGQSHVRPERAVRRHTTSARQHVVLPRRLELRAVDLDLEAHPPVMLERRYPRRAAVTA